MIRQFMDAAKRNILLITASAAALIMLVFAGVVFYQRVVAPPAPPSPPVEYSASEYQPEKAVYAPGETLRYTPTLTLRRETEIAGHRFIISATTRRIAWLCDGTPAAPIPVIGGAEAGTEANIDGGMFVPISIPKLPPGDYWIRSFIHGFGESGGQATYRVFFRIDQAC